MQADMKQGILLAAFGASGRQNESVLQLFDAEVRARFSLPVRWAFTSPLLRERLALERKKTDSVRKALEKMAFERYRRIAVQPLQCIPGLEYADVLEDARVLESGRGIQVRVGQPLLHSEADIAAAAKALVRHLPPERAADDAAVWVGHGTRHAATDRYAALACAVREIDPLVHVGTLGDARALPRLLEALRAQHVRRVLLLPLLSVVGRHALRDLAGSAPGSWKSEIEAAGLSCSPVLKGSAEYSGFIRIWLDHLDAALREF